MSRLLQVLPQKRGRELTKNGRFSLSKALLEHCDSEKSAPEVYKLYFRPFTLVDADSNVSCLKSRPHLEEKVRNSLYNLREDKADPAFFNFSSHQDINRLCSVIGAEIVIYFSNVECSFLELYHDFRCLSTDPLRKTVYFLLDVGKNLYKLDESFDECTACQQYFFSLRGASIIHSLQEDYGTIFARAFDLPPPPFSIKSIMDLTFSTQKLYAYWKKTILLVTFCRSTFTYFSKRTIGKRKHPKFSIFLNLGVIGPPAESLSELDLRATSTRVACFYAVERVCELTDSFRNKVIENYIKTTGRDKPKSNDYMGIPKVNLENQRIALAIYQAKKKKNRRKNKDVVEDGGNSQSNFKNQPNCKCETCKSTDYDVNMNVLGPEKLCSSSLDISDLLGLLGASSPENLKIVEEMCALSIASMDIESMTVNINLDPPVDQIGGLNYGLFDSASLEGHFKKVQKPIMIAHLDGLSDEKVKVFTVESDEEEKIYEMMELYWKHVTERHRLTTQAKKFLAQPLFDLIQKYREAHFSAYAEWIQHRLFQSSTSASSTSKEKDADAQNITQAWFQTLPGLLEKQLQKLATEYVVFSFYG